MSTNVVAAPGDDGQQSDLDQKLDQRQAELESSHAREVAEAVAAGKRQELNQRLERERQSNIAAIDKVINDNRLHFHVDNAKVVEFLGKADLPVTEQGLKDLIQKYPGLCDQRTTKKLLGDTPALPEKAKIKTRSDFPNSRSEFTSVEQRVEFINQFGEDAWEGLAARPVTRKHHEQLTTAEYYALSAPQKVQIVEELEAKGDSLGAFLKRIKNNRPAA